jgi:hypothetical protein
LLLATGLLKHPLRSTLDFPESAAADLVYVVAVLTARNFSFLNAHRVIPFSLGRRVGDEGVAD